MPTLRLTQHRELGEQHRVEIVLERERRRPRKAVSTFEFSLPPQDHEDLRWYLEDFLQYPQDPAPKVAARIEKRITELGYQLFQAVFRSSDAQDLWATLREDLQNTRLEIETSVEDATAIPWELLRDPKTDAVVALRASAFVRTHLQAADETDIAISESGPIRILLTICRPERNLDVPFRSVGGQVVKSFSQESGAKVQLDVLRPATYERLAQVLRDAKSAGRPYHILHFDGHGVYADIGETYREGPHGHLAFENPDHAENVRFVAGTTLGKLLKETDVPLLVLNACRSAHAEAPTEPRRVRGAGEKFHNEVRAFGSLALEVMDAGALGVVAMRYNVFVVTAAQFVFGLYRELIRGRSLGEAASVARKQLAEAPNRTIAYDPRPLQDWCVPIVYEAAPIRLFAQPVTTQDNLAIDVAAGQYGRPSNLNKRLPRPPDVGFYGRDETLLAIDRAFDEHAIVLLHAYAGSGKTAAVAEFGRWYSQTGGVDGPVLFTSFEQYKPLPRVLECIPDVFSSELQQADVRWPVLDNAERRDVALQLLQQVPALWIWDNVESVAGFPFGCKSAWTAAEQQELADFLRDAANAKAKFLLTSRRDERSWLGDTLPRRIVLPPMPMQERMQLARALAQKHGRRLTEVDDWRPLLRFTEGNPLSIVLLVGQALRDGVRTKKEVGEFVQRLRAGEQAFPDEATQGRSKSLGASLAYGFFGSAFTEDERKRLALLHLFQGFVDVEVLVLMGDPSRDWCLSAVRGLTREAGILLLNRAAEVGLLSARGGGRFDVHPAVPWFFKDVFENYFPRNDSLVAGEQQTETSPQPQTKTRGARLSATRAFVASMAFLSENYFAQYEAGKRDVIQLLEAEEANLLHARQLARANNWPINVIRTMQGLRALYDHTGRRSEWSSLVDETPSDFEALPNTDGLKAGERERVATEYIAAEFHVRRAREAGRLDEAERLQRQRVEFARQLAASALSVPPDALDSAQRCAVQVLAIALNEFGEIQRELGRHECVARYQEAIQLFERIDDRAPAAACTFNLAIAHYTFPAIRDLDKAEQFFRRSLQLGDENDPLHRGRCFVNLGHVAVQRCSEPRATSFQQCPSLLDAARQYYMKALEVLPSDNVIYVAQAHQHLGNVYGFLGDLDRALEQYRESLSLAEASENLLVAGYARASMASVLKVKGRQADARDYAEAALRNLQSFAANEEAKNAIHKTHALLASLHE